MEIVVFGNRQPSGDFYKSHNYRFVDISNSFIEAGDVELGMNELVSMDIDKDTECVIIDVDNITPGSNWRVPEYCLCLAMSIRLSVFELGKGALSPIILFTRGRSLDDFLHNKYSNVILTEGIELKREKEELDEALIRMKPLDVSDYKEKFLEKIKVLPKPDEGHHSIANQWGADVLSRAVFGRSLKNDVIDKARLSMYFKYVRVQTLNVDELGNTIGDGNKVAVSARPQKIDAKDKKVLLIDDEADKGWKSVLEEWLVDSKLEVIDDTAQDYESLPEEFRSKIEKGVYDLIFLDLRMNGSEEATIDAREFSGMKILQKIKGLNKGTQVIMLTASNKVWNMKALLDAGADGYYVKESPEYAFSIEDSKSNAEKLRETIEECFSKGYLREIWPKINEVKELIGKFDGDEREVDDEKEGNWVKESLLGIDVAFDLLARSNDENRYREFAFLQLFVPIENYTKASNVFLDTNEYLYLYRDDRSGYKIACENHSTDSAKTTNKGKRVLFKSKISMQDGKYVMKSSDIDKRSIREANYRVSAILMYKFGEENSSSHKWTEIYKKRNEIAHGENCEVLDEDFEKIIVFMKFFFNTDKVKWRDSPEKLPDFAEQLTLAGYSVKLSRKSGRG